MKKERQKKEKSLNGRKIERKKCRMEEERQQIKRNSTPALFRGMNWSETFKNFFFSFLVFFRQRNTNMNNKQQYCTVQYWS
jgi:hypothetical protein